MFLFFALARSCSALMGLEYSLVATLWLVGFCAASFLFNFFNSIFNLAFSAEKLSLSAIAFKVCIVVGKIIGKMSSVLLKATRKSRLLTKKSSFLKTVSNLPWAVPSWARNRGACHFSAATFYILLARPSNKLHPASSPRVVSFYPCAAEQIIPCHIPVPSLCTHRERTSLAAPPSTHPPIYSLAWLQNRLRSSKQFYCVLPLIFTARLQNRLY